MKFSWNQCTQFAIIANSYLERSKQKETKLTYALSRVLSRVQKEQPKVSEALVDIDIDHCVTGDNDVIFRDPQGNLQYTKANLKLRNSAKTKRLDAANVEIEPHFATSLPDDLTVFEIEAFSGFVIQQEDAERLLLECEARSDTVAQPEQNGHRAEAAALATA